MTKKRRNIFPFATGALFFTAVHLIIMHILGNNILAHSSYDTYTLMALAWRKGLLHLEQDYPWLELAVYGGQYYVSFPSVPALVMLPLTLVFGGQTPSNLVVFAYLLLSYAAGYALARRTRSAVQATVAALFLTMGCSLLACIQDGGVWYQAQLLSFLLMLLFALGITGKTPLSWGLGLFALALAVGCRPFQALFVPAGLWLLYQNLRRAGKPLRRGLPLLIAPACVAVALAAYNYVRFGNVLEFGHNYLPEFTRDPDQPQMAAKYILQNLPNILRLPHFENGLLVFERFNGNNIFLCCPLFVFGLVEGIALAVRRKWDCADVLAALGLVAEGILLLAHKTLGGWQFGARYFCDLLPMVFLLTVRRRRETPFALEAVLAVFAVALNIYGTLWFYTAA